MAAFSFVKLIISTQGHLIFHDISNGGDKPCAMEFDSAQTERTSPMILRHYQMRDLFVLDQTEIRYHFKRLGPWHLLLSWRSGPSPTQASVSFLFLLLLFLMFIIVVRVCSYCVLVNWEERPQNKFQFKTKVVHNPRAFQSDAAVVIISPFFPPSKPKVQKNANW